MSNECPRAQTTRRSTRSSGMWQSRTGQTSMDRLYRLVVSGEPLDPCPAGERLGLRADIAAVLERAADLIGGLFGICGQVGRTRGEEAVVAHGALQGLARAGIVFGDSADRDQAR